MRFQDVWDICQLAFDFFILIGLVVDPRRK